MRRFGGVGFVRGIGGESGTFSFVVTREMFELMEERFEGVGVEELGEFGGESPRG
jgi:hypothetical protein